MSPTGLVYNIEVHGEHVYQVGELGVLVHNECVYRAFDEAGNVIYVGITKAFSRRKAEHLREKGIEIVKLIDGLTRDAARGIEQKLIEIHKFKKDEGTLINLINSIATSNAKYKDLTEQRLKALKELKIGY
jgi:predicted GIY-YIG superfamily endonuclease